MTEPVFSTPMPTDILAMWIRDQIMNDCKFHRQKYDYILRCTPIFADTLGQLLGIIADETPAEADGLRYRWGQTQVVRDPDAVTPTLERYEYRSLEAVA